MMSAEFQGVFEDEATRDSAVLDVSHVTAGYGTTTVLRDVSLTVSPGEVVALLGPNGAGKTTTLRACSGLIRPDKGRIRLDGRDVTATPVYARSDMGLCLIPERRGIFRTLTVEQNLRLLAPPGRRVAGQAIERAIEVFPALAGRLTTAAGHLSGGQQQMLSLARAYMTSPKIILLDEVSMGLAPRVVDEMFVALNALAKTGVAMLLVEQYVNRAMEMAQRVVVLDKGSVTFDGPSSELKEEDVIAGYLGEGTIHDAASSPQLPIV
jgi:branched-chain amino acid transport system ATP-binding protein